MLDHSSARSAVSSIPRGKLPLRRWLWVVGIASAEDAGRSTYPARSRRKARVQTSSAWRADVIASSGPRSLTNWSPPMCPKSGCPVAAFANADPQIPQSAQHGVRCGCPESSLVSASELRIHHRVHAGPAAYAQSACPDRRMSLRPRTVLWLRIRGQSPTCSLQDRQDVGTEVRGRLRDGQLVASEYEGVHQVSIHHRKERRLQVSIRVLEFSGVTLIAAT